MPIPQDKIDQYAALQGTGSQIPGIIRSGNSYSAAPGSALAGQLSSAENDQADVNRWRQRNRPPEARTNTEGGFFGSPGARAALQESAKSFPAPGGDEALLNVRQSLLGPVQGVSNFVGGALDKAARAGGILLTGQVPPKDQYGNDLTQTRDAQRQIDALKAAQVAPGDTKEPATAEPAPTGIAPKPGRQTSFNGTGTVTQEPGAILRDGYGNNTAQQQSYQRQLDQARAENDALNTSRADAAERAPGTSYREQQQAQADRFTRFVNQSETARLIHDLGTGGGTAKTNAGRIEAVRAAQLRDAAAQASELQRSGQIIAANTARQAQQVQSKGQQRAQETALAQILGSPADQHGKLLDAAIKSGQLDQAQVLKSLQEKLLSAGEQKDTAAQARYAALIQQLQGKSPESKLVSFGGGQTVDATGNVINNRSQLAYTGPAPTIVNPDQGQPPPKPQIGDTIPGAKDGNALYAGTKVKIKDGKIVALGEK